MCFINPYMILYGQIIEYILIHPIIIILESTHDLMSAHSCSCCFLDDSVWSVLQYIENVNTNISDCCTVAHPRDEHVSA